MVKQIDNSLSTLGHQLNNKELFQLSRNKVLLLIGFWRSLRSDEICNLTIENIRVNAKEGMEIFIPSSKTDRLNKGRQLQLPALSSLCPIDAYLDWLSVSQLTSGPVFRKIDRWGNISDAPLKPASISIILRRIFDQAGLDEAINFSSHSFRRGFATWANQNNWDLKALMEYVGWKDMKSALKYIDNSHQYAKVKMELGLSQLPSDKT
ncbi:MAG: site-specific integrase [Cellvibrionales bacterium]|nr:site-specific integrase [Cellvibrionales bacterium]